MAIDFPSTPVDGTTYDYQGVRYIWKEVSVGVGYWRVYTPGTVGIATPSEIDAGTEGIKYITPEGLSLSKYNNNFRQYGLGEAWLPFLYDLTGSVRAGYYYCPAGTPGNPDADPYIIQATNGEVVTAISDAEAGKIFNGWRTNDSAGAFTWREMMHSGNAFGIGQTWQNMFSVRLKNTDYTNDTSKPIMLEVSANDARGGSNLSSVNVIIDGLAMPMDRAGTIYRSVIIPAGSTYRVAMEVNNDRVLTWWEFRD